MVFHGLLRMHQIELENQIAIFRLISSFLTNFSTFLTSPFIYYIRRPIVDYRGIICVIQHLWYNGFHYQPAVTFQKLCQILRNSKRCQSFHPKKVPQPGIEPPPG